MHACRWGRKGEITLRVEGRYKRKAEMELRGVGEAGWQRIIRFDDFAGSECVHTRGGFPGGGEMRRGS